MLSGSSNTHGEKITDSLRVEAFCMEPSKGGRDVVESACGLLRGGLFTKNNRTGFAVTLNVKMSTEASECWFDFIETILGGRGAGVVPSTPGSWRVGHSRLIDLVAAETRS